jgi:hypothetical protein
MAWWVYSRDFSGIPLAMPILSESRARMIDLKKELEARLATKATEE